MPAKDYIPTKEGDIVISTSKTTYETPLTEPSGRNFFRIKAQKGELTSEGSNIIIL